MQNKIKILIFISVLGCSNSNDSSLNYDENETLVVEPKQEKPQLDLWSLDKIEKGVLYFENGKKLNTKLNEVSYISTLRDSLMSYLVLSAKPCDSCDANSSIYIVPCKEGKLTKSEKLLYSYPGKEYDYLDNFLVFESLFFYDYNQKLYWVQNEMMDNNEWRRSIFIVSLNNGEILEEEIIDNVEIEKIKTVLKQEAKELEGVDKVTEP